MGRSNMDHSSLQGGIMGNRFLWVGIIALGISWMFPIGPCHAAPRISEDTEACLACHSTATPGIVADWRRSQHAAITPEEAMKKYPNAKKVSSEKIPGKLQETVVGCAECHTLNSSKHKDSFEHSGLKVHVIVTPEDCSTCHSAEAKQYEKNIMSHAYGNLQNNPLYHQLADSINGIQSFDNGRLIQKPPDPETEMDSCLYCHGTEVKVRGFKAKDTDMGTMDFPILSGWPNQGVGRINPDGSKGSCTACHTRHQFSMEMARKPETCSECHKGPDVPAYAVYQVSKHGNIYSSLRKEWDFKAVPWTVGKDFSAPTCAACHISLVVNEAGNVVTERTHQMNNRLSWRIFGPIYAHAHPKSPDTTIIKNKAGLPLPTELTGEPVSAYLIDAKEQEKRQAMMQNLCLTCHSNGWVKGHFTRFENTLQTTNEMVRAATEILLTAWKTRAAKGPAQKDSIFNEAIEKKWVEQWLFYANSTRFASAMAGADYGVFANGRWWMSKNLQEMLEWLESKSVKKSAVKSKPSGKP
jgi:hydroxylamine dehydrogenase